MTHRMRCYRCREVGGLILACVQLPCQQQPLGTHTDDMAGASQKLDLQWLLGPSTISWVFAISWNDNDQRCGLNAIPLAGMSITSEAIIVLL